MKLSRRDLPFALATGRVGATTVAATMICARLAGIEVFVTGGIGGVHRGAETSFDISADLQELARTPVAVVCAGAKSILDLALTLEYLETHGVPVLSVGQENFAAFYTRDSGLKADFRIDAPADQARFLRTKWALGLSGGAVISNPVPAAHEMPRAVIDGFVEQALAEASAQGISGKAVTPYLLARIKDLTRRRQPRHQHRAGEAQRRRRRGARQGARTLTAAGPHPFLSRKRERVTSPFQPSPKTFLHAPIAQVFLPLAQD